MAPFGSSTSRPGPLAMSPVASSLQTLRSQAAYVRALLDEVERLAPLSPSEEISEQVVDEIARLGSRSLQVAAELRRLVALADKCA